MTEQNETPTIEHLIRCYSNVQEVLRFLDTKAAVLFTISGVMLGALAIKPAEWCSPSIYGFLLAMAFVILSMFFALRVVWPYHGPDDPNHLSLLFPALNPKAKVRKKTPEIAALVKQKVQNPLTFEQVRDEYGNQLSHLNVPLVRKISSLRWSIRFIVAALITAGLCQFGRKLDVPDKPLSVKCTVSAPVSIAGSIETLNHQPALAFSQPVSAAPVPPEPAPVPREPAPLREPAPVIPGSVEPVK